MEEEKKQYIGPNEVKSFDSVTIKGIEYLEVQYANGSHDTLSKKMFDAVVTVAPTDLTDLRNRRLYPIVSDILKTINEYNIKISELDIIAQLLITSLDENINEASSFIFGSDKYSRTMLDVDKVLQKKNESSVKITVNDVISPKENTDPPVSTP